MFDLDEFKQTVTEVVRKKIDAWSRVEGEGRAEVISYVHENALDAVRAFAPKFDNATCLQVLTDHPDLFDEKELNSGGESVREVIVNVVQHKVADAAVIALEADLQVYLAKEPAPKSEGAPTFVP